MTGTKDVTERPWNCTERDAVYCPHHGTCTCTRSAGYGDITERAPNCGLHGYYAEHPLAEPTMKGSG